MRELTIEETVLLKQRGYIPNSCVKISSNNREYVLVKNNNGKKLGARFLSSLKKKEETRGISSNRSNEMGSNRSNEMGSNRSNEMGSNNNKNNDKTKAVVIKEEGIDKLLEIGDLHKKILELQNDLHRLETKYESGVNNDIFQKKKELDTVSMVIENKIEENKSILPDKNTILDIINDIL